MCRFINAIRAAQNGENEQMLYLIDQFTPLLRKYARRLHMEDAENELILRFLEIITYFDVDKMENQSDGAITKYLCSAIYHAYCKLQAKQTEYHMVDIDDPTIQQFLMTLPENSASDKLPHFPDGLLTNTEHTVIRLLYEQGYSSTIIARKLGVSRQSVNQTKLRALKKLQKYYRIT